MKKIYKYVKFEDALKIINNNSVKLNNPNNYNDPFDSDVEIDKKEEQKSFDLILEFYFLYALIVILYNKEIKYSFYKKIKVKIYRFIYKFYINLIIKQGYYSNPVMKLMIKVLLKYTSLENKNTIEEKKIEFIESVSAIVKDVKKSINVSCFSNRNDSILMWSHYADKHKGVCFEFERPKKDFHDVLYRKKRKTFNLYNITSIVLGQILKSYKSYNFESTEVDIKSFTNDDASMIKKIMNPFLVKSLDWKYEEEIRCIFSDKEYNENIVKLNNDLVLYKMPNKFSKVYLGCNIDIENELLIRKELAETNIPVVKFRVSNYKFELDKI